MTDGPYERWVNTPALGRPFAVPAGRQFSHVVGIAQGVLPAAVRSPDLWDGGAPTGVMPYAMPMGTAKPGGVRARNGLPLAPESWVQTYEPASVQVPQPAQPVRAIIAVIDDELPFANRAFCDAYGHSRVAHLWLQAGRSAGTAAVPFGAELTAAQIDQARAQAADEIALYRACGAIDPRLPDLGAGLARATTHGSHVMGLAAGADPIVGSDMPDDVLIIGVQLPRSLSWDTSGFGREGHVLWALHYIFDRARRIAQAQGGGDLPLVINCSYGWPAGRDDGQDDLADALSEMVLRRQAHAPTELVVPAGNHFDAGLAARLDQQAFDGGQADLVWRVLPDDHTNSYLEIWFPPGCDNAAWSVEIDAPEGVSLAGGRIGLVADPNHPGIDPGAESLLVVDGQVIGRMSVDCHRGTRWRALIALIPTQRMMSDPRQAPAGGWRVRIVNSGSDLTPQQAVQVCVQRDDDPVRLGIGARQSYLEPRDGARPAALGLRQYPDAVTPISSFGALNVLATAPGVRVVASLIDDQRPAPYSATSLVDHTGQADVAVDMIAATSERSALRPGLVSIGVLSGSRSIMRGTSVASPVVARAMVLNLAAGRAADHGFAPAPDLPPLDPPTSLTRALHVARVGRSIAPQIPPPFEVRRNPSGPMA